MKLRSGTHVAQITSGGMVQNPKAFQDIAQHNAGSRLLMLPQEIKNRIYHFVCGGQMVHICQIDNKHHHVHGNENVPLSHALCISSRSEEQIQKDFDSAVPNPIDWTVPAVQGRHDICHRPPPAHIDGTKPNQLSLTLLRSCRQIYFEANNVQYTHNTFGFFCHDVLERFVRARCQKKQNFAIRSLYLDVSIVHFSSVDAWSETMTKTVLRHLKCVRYLHLNLTQLYCACSIEVCGYASEMTRRQVGMFKKLGNLPLKEATLVVDDSAMDSDDDLPFFDRYRRWTIGEKQLFSREIRDALLG